MVLITEKEAREFTDRWLPAWTGNDPARLAAFYSLDTFYSDPAIPNGVNGREALQGYFKKLLAHYPDWVWTCRRPVPMEGGFANLWHAVIPAAGQVIECDGICLVWLKDGLISRNEVYFDRTALLAAGRKG